jgi:hypothetical protein
MISQTLLKKCCLTSHIVAFILLILSNNYTCFQKQKKEMPCINLLFILFHISWCWNFLGLYVFPSPAAVLIGIMFLIL